MEIIVEGEGVEYFVPDEVILNINFFVKTKTYEEALTNGVKSVENFIDNILVENNFKNEDLKTRSFVIKEQKEYNSITHSYYNDGYSFNQYAILKFDYDKVKLAKIMADLLKLKNAPQVRINFGIKDEKNCRKQILDKAYKDAQSKAEIIALSAGKTLKCCQKVDFKPFENDYISGASFDTKMMMCEKSRYNSSATIVNTFNPEDILLEEHLYCLWIAE